MKKGLQVQHQPLLEIYINYSSPEDTPWLRIKSNSPGNKHKQQTLCYCRYNSA